MIERSFNPIVSTTRFVVPFAVMIENESMSTFADPAARASVQKRIERLMPDAQRRWGRMTAHQMVCHLTDAYRMSLGERKAPPKDNIFTRVVVRRIALHTSLTWPKGVPTLPEADQEKGGTKPIEWERDRAELLRTIAAFDAKDGLGHPIFGPLTAHEWNVWGYRHADHHLRQFGL